jgi:hypothetical protein
VVEAVVAAAEFRAQAADRAAVVGDQFAHVAPVPGERLEPRGWASPLVEGGEHRLDAPVAVFDDTPDEIVLGLEVVVHVAQRDAGCVGDVRQGGRRDALSVHEVACARDKPLSLATPVRVA